MHGRTEPVSERKPLSSVARDKPRQLAMRLARDGWRLHTGLTYAARADRAGVFCGGDPHAIIGALAAR